MLAVGALLLNTETCSNNALCKIKGLPYIYFNSEPSLRSVTSKAGVARAWLPGANTQGAAGRRGPHSRACASLLGRPWRQHTLSRKTQVFGDLSTKHKGVFRETRTQNIFSLHFTGSEEFLSSCCQEGWGAGTEGSRAEPGVVTCIFINFSVSGPAEICSALL